MLQTIYYLIGLFFAYHRHKLFFKIPLRLELSLSKEKIKINVNKKTTLTAEEKELLNEGLISFFFFMWICIGLLTFQWILFAFTLFSGMIFNHFINNFFKEKIKIRILLSRIYIIITWILCVVVCVNYFYLKINSNQIINFFTD